MTVNDPYQLVGYQILMITWILGHKLFFRYLKLTLHKVCDMFPHTKTEKKGQTLTRTKNNKQRVQFKIYYHCAMLYFFFFFPSLKISQGFSTAWEHLFGVLMYRLSTHIQVSVLIMIMKHLCIIWFWGFASYVIQIIFGHFSLQFCKVKQELYFTGYSSLTISEACSKTGASIWLNLHLQGNNDNNYIFQQNLHMSGQHKANNLLRHFRHYFRK